MHARKVRYGSLGAFSRTLRVQALDDELKVLNDDKQKSILLKLLVKKYEYCKRELTCFKWLIYEMLNSSNPSFSFWSIYNLGFSFFSVMEFKVKTKYLHLISSEATL